MYNCTCNYIAEVHPWSWLARSCGNLAWFLVAWSSWGYSVPPEWDANPSQVTTPLQFARFPQQFTGTQLYPWVERGTVRVKCLAQEHNTMLLVRAWTWTSHSRVERTNHETTAPPTVTCTLYCSKFIILVIFPERPWSKALVVAPFPVFLPLCKEKGSQHVELTSSNVCHHRHTLVTRVVNADC